MLRRPEKEQLVRELTEEFQNSSLVLFSDFKGLTVAQMTKLRRSLREKYGNGARLTVVKNTLLRMALKESGYDIESHEKALFGPTAVLYVTEGDPVEAIKVYYNFVKENKGTPVCKGIYLEKKFFPGEQLEELSKLPSREQLIAMVLGGIQAPIRGLVTSLSGVLRSVLYALNA
ncbi:MAG: 50S ribosomal protein L10, partial [Fervidobacterium sp.]